MIKNSQQRYFDYAENLRHLLKHARFRECLLSIVVVALSVSIVYMAIHKQITLVPYGLIEKVQVAINKVSPHYLTTLAMGDAALFFDVDPANIKIQSENFLARVNPVLYGELQLKLLARMKEFLQANLSQVFYPAKIFVQEKENHIQIKGRLIKLITDKVMATQDVTLDIHYQFVNGFAYILGWKYYA